MPESDLAEQHNGSGAKMSGIELIAVERSRQVYDEGYTPEHDAFHNRGSLARAAATYALPEASRDYKELLDGSGVVPMHWPWAAEFWKPMPDDRVRELVKAGALIAAEIDRLQARRV